MVKTVKRLRDSFGNYQKKRKSLKESFASIPDLQAKLNEKMIAIMNESSGGSDKWNLSSKWTDAYNNARSMEEVNALIEIFIEIACPSWGCKLEQLDPGKDIIIKLIDELGFKENENPYINFIKIFFRLNPGVVLREEDWVKLNDWYADSIISASDIKGTGFDGKNHIIFNANLYTDGNISSDNDNYVKFFKLFSEKNEVMSLNIYAIATFEGSPYGALKKYTKDGVNGTGVFTGGDFRVVRNTIFYKDPSKPLGDLYKLYYVQRAYNVGKDVHYKAEGDELATGTTGADLKRLVSDAVKQVNGVLKNITSQIKKFVDAQAQKMTTAKGVKTLQQSVDKANKYLNEDKQVLEDYIKKLKATSNKQDFDTVYEQLVDYVNNKMKVKKVLADFNANISSSGSGTSGTPKKKQSLSDGDIKNVVDNLSDDERKSLIKYLKDIGLIK